MQHFHSKGIWVFHSLSSERRGRYTASFELCQRHAKSEMNANNDIIKLKYW